MTFNFREEFIKIFEIIYPLLLEEFNIDLFIEAIEKIKKILFEDYIKEIE